MDPTRIARLVLLALAALVVAGCSMVPNMDPGTSGCSNAQGIGPRNITQFDLTKPVLPEVIGLSPIEAANLAASQGHTVVFRVEITNFGECWCVPPPEGTVTEAFWNQHGALFLTVSGVDEGHSADEQPPTGWGCP
jgi:hypothetical protein